MKIRKIAAVLVLGIFLLSTMTSGAFAFRDMNTAKWAERHVSKMIAQDVVKGYGDGTFRPNKPVTQGEAVVMTMRMLGDVEVSEAVYSAVYFKNSSSIPDWVYGPAVLAAYEGFIDVSKSENFLYNKPATREWVAKLIVKAFDLQDKEGELTFKDLKQISSDSLPFIKTAFTNGVIKGFPDNSFKPKKPVTRAEIVVMLQLADDLAGLEDPDVSLLATKFRGVITETYNNNVAGEVYLKLNVGKAGEIKLPVSTEVEVYIDGTKKSFDDITVNSKAHVILDKEDKVVTFIDVFAKAANKERQNENKPEISAPGGSDRSEAKEQQNNGKKK